jgi:hypothetical protein
VLHRLAPSVLTAPASSSSSSAAAAASTADTEAHAAEAVGEFAWLVEFLVTTSKRLTVLGLVELVSIARWPIAEAEHKVSVWQLSHTGACCLYLLCLSAECRCAYALYQGTNALVVKRGCARTQLRSNTTVVSAAWSWYTCGMHISNASHHS